MRTTIFYLHVLVYNLTFVPVVLFDHVEVSDIIATIPSQATVSWMRGDWGEILALQTPVHHGL